MKMIKRKVKGVVLAGGEGKRLRPLTYYFQKCMIPIGNKQKPLLEYIIRLLKHHGISDVTMMVGYKHEQIVNYFENGGRFGVNLNYVQDDPFMKGTGAALLNLYRKGLLDIESSILVYYGDILSNIDLTNMLDQHQRRNAVATLALASGYQVPVGVAELKGDTVVGWVEKPTLNLNVGIGILALEAKALNELPRISENKRDLDIMKDLIPHLVDRGNPVHAYITDSFWYDVGSTEKYEKLDNGTIEKYFGFLFR
jgi:mannose-1-phosphate guanylyltransferase